MDLFTPLFYLIAAFAVVIAVLALRRERNAPARRIFSLAIVLSAFETALASRAHHAGSGAHAVFWREWWLLPQALSPAAWLLFVLKYARANFQISFRRWFPILTATALVPVGMITVFHDGVIRSAPATPSGFEIGFPGYVLYLSIVVSSALILMNLERTFRAAVGTIRWRIKFIVLGAATIFVAQLYTASQVLLFRAHPFTFDIIQAVALLIASGLFLRGLLRSGIFQVELYLSEEALQYSVTGILIGAYLVLIGVFSKLFEAWDGPEAFALKAFLLLASLAAVAVLLLSEKTRDRLRRWVSRNFHRPFFNYRALWLSFTEKTASVIEPQALSRTIATWLSENLHVLSATVWLIDNDSSTIRAAASTASTQPEIEITGQEAMELAAALQAEPLPFDIEKRAEPWAQTIKRGNPDRFRKGGNRVCVPLISGATVVGFCLLGDRVNAVPMEIQEFELLKCVADQMAAQFLNLQLSHRLVQAKEMEAFQTISAFFVHDLKNTASTLNLTLQNLPRHFDNPEFRQDALKAVSKSVYHIQELISRLTLFRQKLELNRSATDLNEVVKTALEHVRTSPLQFTTAFSPLKPVQADAGQLEKVVTNLLINAREAVKENGCIEVATSQQNGCAVIAVSDNGCGMPPEFLSRALFRPFKTTKKGGIGIGMFQSKAIVEAHGGRIQVESEVGKGTTFRVYLPAVS